MDALVHGPGWTETPDDELRAKVEPLVRSDGWVIDGHYERKLGDLVHRTFGAVANGRRRSRPIRRCV
jgi:hypothetical protein